jgi:hypothetical protein
VFQIVDFSCVNDLKFTYVRLQFQKIFPGVIPLDPHDKGEERERRGGEGKGGQGKGGEGRGGEGREGWDGVNPPPKTNPGYGPGCIISALLYLLLTAQEPVKVYAAYIKA